MFLTERRRRTSSPDINIYNAYVQAQAAAGHADIQEHANQFRVLASTADDDARDNTETTSSDTDAPIYWLNGAKVADNYADLYDETWDEEVNRRTAAGDLSTTSHIVWTGSDDDGTGRQETGVSVALGETSVRQGELDNSSSTRDPLSALTVTAATNTAPFYALSGIFVVEPNNEATGTLSAKTNGPRVNDVLYTNWPEHHQRPRRHNERSEYSPTVEEIQPGNRDTETDIEDGDSRTVHGQNRRRGNTSCGFSISFTDDQNNPEVLLSEYTPPVVPADVLVRIEYGHDMVDSTLDSTNAKIRPEIQHRLECGRLYRRRRRISLRANRTLRPTAVQHLLVRLEKDDGGTPARALCRLQGTHVPSRHRE